MVLGTMADELAEKRRDTLLDSITEGVFTVDREWRITSFNRAAESITGIPRDRALGRPCKDILRASICEGNCALQETIETGTLVVCKTVDIVDATGKRRPVSISTAVLKDASGAIVGGVETFRDLTTIEQLRKDVTRTYSFEDIISRSDRMQAIFDILPEVADGTSTVLIEGESGTGKELVARAIHNLGSRRGKPFIAVNCGALPDTLLESELFGYKAGAFTDAKKDKLGRVTRADGGTLFLDEVGDVSPALQVRLLRFLQDRVYEPLGSVSPLQADVRIIAATNSHLQDLVEKGSFRRDLFYRINVVRIELPPLRERMEDVPLLVDHIIGRLNRIQGKDVISISDAALACLMSYDFPGNVRELENIIEQAFVLCHSGHIQRNHLPRGLCDSPCVDCLEQNSFSSFQQMEAAFLMNALRRNNWNRAETARQLGMHKTTLFRKIKSLGLEVPSSRGRR